MPPLPDNLPDVSWVVSATQAMADGIARAVAEHKREGLPLAVWRDGEVVWISAEEAEAELAANLAGPPTTPRQP